MVVDKQAAKLGFARRLGQALTDAGVPDNQNRRRWVARAFGVSVESARKWLVGESMPDTARLEGIAKELHCTANWLLTGERNESVATHRIGKDPMQYKPAWAVQPTSADLLSAIEAAHKRGALTPPVVNAIRVIVDSIG